MYVFVKMTMEKNSIRANKGVAMARANGAVTGNCHTKISNSGNRSMLAKMSLLALLLLSILVSGLPSAQAAETLDTYYVRKGATGANDGSDWKDAYTSLPASLQRGATYYVAEGTYDGYTFYDANSGSTMITIKKATVSDHGTESGWSSSYGDGQAVFTGQITFTTSYWIFDGVTGGGPGNWENGFGFRIKRTGSGTKAIRFDSNPSHVTIQHVDIENCGEDTGGNSDTIYTLGSDFVTISYCWIHNTNRTNFLVNGSQNFTLEYSLISDRHNTDSVHGEHMSINNSGMNANHVYRYNIFRDAGGANTGVIVIKDSVQSGFKIYGNIFYNTDYSRYLSTNGIITDTTGDSTTNVKIYNNTFLPHRGISHDSPTVSFDVATGNEFKNNIVFNNGGFSGVSRSYNLYDDSSLANGETGGQFFSSGESALFTNSSAHDYTLKVDTKTGDSSISVEYKKDMFGNTRGADGILDRGALEFVGGSNTISPPSNFRFN